MLHDERLLIVDDEVDFAQLVAEVAASQGYQTRMVHNAADFKREFVEFAPALCFVDVILPDEDGIELIHWLAKRDTSPSVIIASGFNPYYLRLANLIASGRGVGIVATLKKPVSIAMLRSALQRPGTHKQVLTPASAEIAALPG